MTDPDDLMREVDSRYNTNPARTVIVSNQLQVVRQLSLNNHVLICVSCHLIICLTAYLHITQNWLGVFYYHFGVLLGNLVASALGSRGPGEVDKWPSCSSDLLTSGAQPTCLPLWGPLCICSLWGLYGGLRPPP